eukprot:jgi/Mesvir1/22383/Mv17875-RA.1
MYGRCELRIPLKLPSSQGRAVHVAEQAIAKNEVQPLRWQTTAAALGCQQPSARGPLKELQGQEKEEVSKPTMNPKAEGPCNDFPPVRLVVEVLPELPQPSDRHNRVAELAKRFEKACSRYPGVNP